MGLIDAAAKTAIGVGQLKQGRAQGKMAIAQEASAAANTALANAQMEQVELNKIEAQQRRVDRLIDGFNEQDKVSYTENLLLTANVHTKVFEDEEYNNELKNILKKENEMHEENFKNSKLSILSKKLFLIFGILFTLAGFANILVSLVGIALIIAFFVGKNFASKILSEEYITSLCNGSRKEAYTRTYTNLYNQTTKFEIDEFNEEANKVVEENKFDYVENQYLDFHKALLKSKLTTSIIDAYYFGLELP